MANDFKFDVGGGIMGKLTENLFFDLIHDYLIIYLPKQKCFSDNTIQSYRATLNQFVDFVSAKEQLSMNKLTFDVITSSVITEYMEWLLQKKECCAATCNQHLAALRSFYAYAAMMEPLTVKFQNEVLKVPLLKVTKRMMVEYMTEEAIQAILAQPDIKTDKGIRNLFLLILLYDTGARIQEVLNLKLKDIQTGQHGRITLLGKGNKIRTVPLTQNAQHYFSIYKSIFHPIETFASQEYLFYTVHHGKKGKMSDDAVQKFIKKYADGARKTCNVIPENVYPHLWRHSRAMHLYQHGMDLTLISQWLGHAHLETTLIYAHADTELKRQAIEKAMGSPEFETLYKTERYQIDDVTVLKKLYGLK